MSERLAAAAILLMAPSRTLLVTSFPFCALLQDSGRLAVLRQRLPQQSLPFGMIEAGGGLGWGLGRQEVQLSWGPGVGFFSEGEVSPHPSPCSVQQTAC
jgi:hypothetical protein